MTLVRTKRVGGFSEAVFDMIPSRETIEYLSAG